jgi:hypothetical protein
MILLILLIGGYYVYVGVVTSRPKRWYCWKTRAVDCRPYIFIILMHQLIATNPFSNDVRDKIMDMQ